MLARYTGGNPKELDECQLLESMQEVGELLRAPVQGRGDQPCAAGDERIQQVYKDQQHRHPELAAMLTLEGLRRILARDGVDVVMAPLPRPALLVQFLGTWAIPLDSRSPWEHWPLYVPHELAHFWLLVGADSTEPALEYPLFPANTKGEADSLAALVPDSPLGAGS